MLSESFVTLLTSDGLSYQQITFLTFQAVVEVVLICLSGFWAARTGLLNNEATKVISRLNVDLFTPALIFTKLASSLSLKKLLEVIIIPILYAITTGVSYVASLWTSSVLGLSEPESNFVTAMAVFGNSNSLPVSLTLALAYTLPGLEWDDVEDDSPDQIASRGLIYLLIFQQLGQMLRWSWGYNSLLKKQQPLLLPIESPDSDPERQALTPDRPSSYGSVVDQPQEEERLLSPPPNADGRWSEGSSISSHETISKGGGVEEETENQDTSVETVPRPIVVRVFLKFLSAMNPPLWAMLISVIVASIPQIRYEFYERNGFIQNTVANAIKQLGSVSIPLILVVLGANLAPSSEIPPACPNYSKMIFGSLISRMVLPSIVLLPVITFAVKYISLSILDDPIFLVTSFLLITSPPAIQLSQICQLNEIYQKEMAGVLFYGYVILTLPVTIVIVVSALECLKWAKPL
ncbi:hypothetical protein OGAPHI_002120 [Ogataea philodendri]|uniref:Auxin efflux carrier n=1 Tax=Ogataea philodendri TaxID=1378263 RepID=A0A9P8PAV6_9ASCO|nr:uncharacterized protein OGAPHI_002120 [Ogataea philodendri]KAH3668366.1 hypothetical protein OGAPHI_002120 [Ogataea philodendri]